MTKRALMLTAATMALLSGPAMAQDFSDITTEVDQQLMTSTANNGAPSDILIESSGSVVVTVAAPAIEIDSANSVTNQGKITNLDTDGAIGVQLDATAAGNGPGVGITALDNAGTIDLSGKGTSKTGVLLGIFNGDTSGIFNGDINFETGSALKVVGDGSIGVHFASDTVLNGNLTMDGNIGVSPSDPKALSGGEVVAFRMDGDINGNISIGDSANVIASGVGAQGVMLFGNVDGSFTNLGRIEAIGTSSPTSGGVNPEAFSAFVVTGNITGGILNDGPAFIGDNTSAAQMTLTGISPAVFISPVADGAQGGATIHIGTYTDDTLGDVYSFINRGAISAVPVDPDNDAAAMRFLGGSTAVQMIFDGGLYNSGSISASAQSDTSGALPLLSQGIYLAQYSSIPTLVNSTDAGNGTIQALLSGPKGGTAVAIQVDENASLGSIVNQGSIRAVAATSDTSITTGLAAYGILDKSGTINSIINSGTIAALATTLDDDSQIADAVDLSVSQQNIMFDNSGSVVGKVFFGSGDDTLIVHGNANAPASVAGDIEFGGTADGGFDSLIIQDFGAVKGAITDGSGGQLDVDVSGGTIGGTLTLTNDSLDLGQRFIARNFLIEDGGNLGLTLSQTYNIAANPTAGGIVTTTGNATLQSQARLDLSFGSFLTSPGDQSQFILIDSQGALNVDLDQLDNQVCANLPFLFSNTDNKCLDVVTSGGDQQLVMTLTPKTAEQMNLSGYALKMFPLANAALATDDQLGAAVINAGLPVNGVALTDAQGDALYQAIYSAFAPNLTGAARKLAISITDQATGPVGARQRALRMYAAQSGDATLWGEEFGETLNQDASTDTVGYRDTGFGFALGLDGGNPSDGRYGAAVTFFSGDANEKTPRVSKTNTEWILLTGYTDWRGRGFFLDTQLTGGYGHLDGKRFLNVGGVSRVAEGKRGALLGAGGLSTGVILTTGSTVFTPLISLDGLAMREDGYQEGGGGDPTGGDGFDLKVSPAYYHSLRGFGGADLRQDLNLGDFFLQPEVRAGYRYDFSASPETLHAQFVSTGDTFTLTGPDPDKGNLVLGGSIAATTDVWSIGLNYDYLRGNNGAVSQDGTITLVGRI